MITRSTGRLAALTVAAALASLGCVNASAGAGGPTVAPLGTSTPATTAGAAGVPPFRWQVRTATKSLLGRSWRAGCPVPPRDLRIVGLTYWHFDGTVRNGVLIIHEDVVRRTRPVFASLYRRHFPIRSIRPVTDYGASDDASMAADNTSGFNCRRAVASGPPTWSRHAYGRAIDINPVENPYVFRGRVLPPAGRRYVDRRRARPGMIRKGDPAQTAFARAGYRWGGTWSSPDYQHFDR